MNGLMMVWLLACVGWTLIAMGWTFMLRHQQQLTDDAKSEFYRELELKLERGRLSPPQLEQFRRECGILDDDSAALGEFTT